MVERQSDDLDFIVSGSTLGHPIDREPACQFVAGQQSSSELAIHLETVKR
ncbi:hypothetical protein [Halocatena halophila]